MSNLISKIKHDQINVSKKVFVNVNFYIIN